MRVRHLILAVTIATAVAPVAAQDFGGLARGALGRTAKDLAGQAVRQRAPRTVAPASETPPVSTSSPATQSEGSIVVAENMPVMSSDGVRVAEVKHTNTGGTTYAADKTFFTADPYYRLRRIYGREAIVRGGAVHLKMSAAQYRARNQNPD